MERSNVDGQLQPFSIERLPIQVESILWSNPVLELELKRPVIAIHFDQDQLNIGKFNWNQQFHLIDG